MQETEITKTQMNKLVKSYIYSMLKNIEVDHEAFIDNEHISDEDNIQHANYHLFSNTLEYQLKRICDKLEKEEKDIYYNTSLFELVKRFQTHKD